MLDYSAIYQLLNAYKINAFDPEMLHFAIKLGQQDILMILLENSSINRF